MKRGENCRLVSFPHFESLVQDDPVARRNLQAAKACLSLSSKGAEPFSVMVVLRGERPVGLFLSKADAPPLIELFPDTHMNEDVILGEICAELEVTGVL